MNFNQKVSNPMLVGTIELYKAENTPEHREMLEDEIVKATFLSPILIDPEPEKNESGGIIVKQGSKLQFPSLTAQNGARFFMAFTDRMELEKSGHKEDYHEAALNFADYMVMLFKNDPQNAYAGFVINPYGGNIVLPKDIVMALYMKQNAKKGI